MNKVDVIIQFPVILSFEDYHEIPFMADTLKYLTNKCIYYMEINNPDDYRAIGKFHVNPFGHARRR